MCCFKQISLWWFFYGSHTKLVQPSFSSWLTTSSVVRWFHVTKIQLMGCTWKPCQYLRPGPPQTLMRSFQSFSFLLSSLRGYSRFLPDPTQWNNHRMEKSLRGASLDWTLSWLEINFYSVKHPYGEIFGVIFILGIITSSE